MSEGLHHAAYRRKGFLDRTLAELTQVLDRAFNAELSASRNGLLQKLDPRFKLAGALILIVTAAASRSLELVLAVLALAIALALASRLKVRELLTLWIGVALFGGLIALPAVFVTTHGSRIAALLIARALATSTLGWVLVSTTQWTHLLRALRAFHVPVVAVVLIGMTYRYIFLFVQTAVDMLIAKQSRVAGLMPLADRRRMALGTAGVLMSKAFELSSDVHLAMQARGYRGEVHVLDEGQR